MKRLKVMTVIGTRPEIIRLSRVMAKLDLYCEHIIVHTGQNYDFECIKDEYEQTSINLQDQILKDFNEHISKHPDKRIQKIFSMRYSGNKKLIPWRKISKVMNLSIQGCINIHNAALNSISKNIRSKYEIISQRSN